MENGCSKLKAVQNIMLSRHWLVFEVDLEFYLESRFTSDEMQKGETCYIFDAINMNRDC